MSLLVIRSDDFHSSADDIYQYTLSSTSWPYVAVETAESAPKALMQTLALKALYSPSEKSSKIDD